MASRKSKFDKNRTITRIRMLALDVEAASQLPKRKSVMSIGLCLKEIEKCSLSNYWKIKDDATLHQFTLTWDESSHTNFVHACMYNDMEAIRNANGLVWDEDTFGFWTEIVDRGTLMANLRHPVPAAEARREINAIIDAFQKEMIENTDPSLQHVMLTDNTAFDVTLLTLVREKMWRIDYEGMFLGRDYVVDIGQRAKCLEAIQKKKFTSCRSLRPHVPSYDAEAICDTYLCYLNELRHF